MSRLWYYAHDEKKLGPFSQGALKQLAADGTLLPIDTVWLDGVADGVPANQVKNLFPWLAVHMTPAVEVIAAPVEAMPAAEPLVVNTSLMPLEKPSPSAPPKLVKKGRAVALQGADIVSQDGSNARYRKKCIECGHKDSACHSVVISNRVTKQNFFCPKCRKRREVVIQCHL